MTTPSLPAAALPAIDASDPPHAAASPVALYLARLAPESRRTMRGVLERVARLITGGALGAREFPFERLRYEHVQFLRATLAERHSPAHANKILAALRGVLKEAWRLGALTRDEYERAVDVPRVRGRALPRGRALAEGEIARILDSAARDVGPAGLRDRALLSLSYSGGLRRGEVVALDLTDVNLETGEVVVRSGKGHKARVVYLPDGAREALAAWLGVRGSDEGPLFVRIRKGGQVTGERLSTQGLYVVLKRRAREAGVDDVSPHDLRRTCATRLLERGVDLGVVQRVLGHADVSTTLRYDHRGVEAVRQAAAVLALPADGALAEPV